MKDVANGRLLRPASARHFRRGVATLSAGLTAALLLTGCVQQGETPERAPEPVFYPAPPAPPRLQYLTSFSRETDVGKPAADFASFIVGEDPGVSRLQQPYGAAMSDGKLYVVDSRAPGLAIFDLVRQEFHLQRGAGGGRFKRPINITIDADGTRYVTDTGRDQVLVFDRNDRFLVAFGAPGQFKPVDVAIAGDRLYVVDIQHHSVHVLDKHTGAVLFRFGKAGSAPGELFHPTNIAIGPGGDVFVADTSNFRVQRFNADGDPLRVYGQVGDSVGSFARPKGIAIDRDGRLFVGDSAFENVQVFGADGRLLTFFGAPQAPFAGLNLPTAVSIDYGNVELFQRYAAPGFDIGYLVLVVSQFGPNKVDVFGFGTLRGDAYPAAAETGAETTSTQVQ